MCRITVSLKLHVTAEQPDCFTVAITHLQIHGSFHNSYGYISTKNTKRCSHVLSYWLHDTCQGQTEWYMMADATPDWGLDLISPFCSFYIEVLFNSDNCQQKARDERSSRNMFWYSTIMGSHAFDCQTYLSTQVYIIDT